MAQAYQEQAEAFAKMASEEVVTTQQVKDEEKKADDKLNAFREQNLQEFDKAFKTAAENEVGYNADAAQGIANSMAQGASSAAKSLSDLSEASAAVARTIVTQFNNVAEGIKAALSGQTTDPSSIEGNSEAASMVSSEGQEINRDILKEIAQGDTININGAEYIVGD